MPQRSRAARPLSAALLFALLTAGPAAGDPIKLAPVGGGVVAEGGKTVVLSLPSEGALLYFDAEAEKEVKKVEVDFQPLALAVQGQTLFASARGASVVRVLDLATGKEQKAITMPGEPILDLACHPSKGLLYASNAADQVFAIDPKTGKANRTRARGQRLAVDARDGTFVYTGIQKPIRDRLVVEEGPNRSLRLSLETTGARAMMLKFRVNGSDLRLAAFQDNAALNGRSLALSPDGKRIAMAGGGGWVSKTEQRYSYGIAVFETSDMQTMAGQVEVGAYPLAVAFHPVLNLGVALKSGGEVFYFNPKSLARKGRAKVAEGEPPLALFAAGGTKLVHVTCVNSGGATSSQLTFLPLPLTEQDREALKAAPGK